MPRFLRRFFPEKPKPLAQQAQKPSAMPGAPAQVQRKKLNKSYYEEPLRRPHAEKPFVLSSIIGERSYALLVKAVRREEVINELIAQFNPPDRKLIPEFIEKYGIEELARMIISNGAKETAIEIKKRLRE